MAHSKSALKRWRQSLVRRDRNRSVKSRTRTLLNKALAAIADDASSAEAPVREAVSALDTAAQKGVIHANSAARGKARLLKRFNLATAGAVAAAAAGDQAQPRRGTGRSRTSSTESTRRSRGRQGGDSADRRGRRPRKS